MRLLKLISFIVALGFIASACGEAVEVVAPAEDFGPVVGDPPVTSSTTPTSSSSSAVSTTSEVPTDALPFEDPISEAPEAEGESDDAEPETDASTIFAGLPRTTPDGISLTAVIGERDFGSGPTATLEITGRGQGGFSAVISESDVTSSTATIDSIIWGSGGQILVVLLEVGPEVKEVSLYGDDGSSDIARPTSDGLAAGAVLGSNADSFRAEAFDADGTLIGECAHDGSFLRCTD